MIENYYVSDGHGHSYTNYYTHGLSLGARRSVVILLCQDVDTNLLVEGWEKAPIVTYSNMLKRLMEDMGQDQRYRDENRRQAWFLVEVSERFIKGDKVHDQTVENFIKALSDTGAAGLYGAATAEERFLKKIQEEAQRKYTASREALHRVKHDLKSYLAANLSVFDDGLGVGAFREASLPFKGIFQWIIVLEGNQSPVHISFGPSIWSENTVDRDGSWDHKIVDADYSRLFIGDTGSRTLHQSSVTISDVLRGLTPENNTLIDEIVAAVRGQ